jgi:hypothetical protein
MMVLLPVHGRTISGKRERIQVFLLENLCDTDYP